jgi:signal peptidase I
MSQPTGDGPGDAREGLRPQPQKVSPQQVSAHQESPAPKSAPQESPTQESPTQQLPTQQLPTHESAQQESAQQESAQQESAQQESAQQESPAQEPEKSPKRHRWSILRETGGILVTAVLVSLVIKTLLVQAFFIPSGSMEPTLHGCPGCLGDRVLVNKLTDQLGGVRRGDIVVFHDSNNWLPPVSPAPGLGGRVQDAFATIGLAPTTSEGDLVKRVIGIGGDTVEARDGKVFVNGTQLKEPYVFPGNSPSTVDFRVTVPVGKLWVMGDHRSESADSRFHMHDAGKGFVPMTDVVGRAFVIVWPLGRFGSLDRPATFDTIAAPAKH